MGTSTEELTHQVEESRGRLGDDLDALQEKVSPQAILQRRRDAARGGVRRLRERVMGTAHDLGSQAEQAGHDLSRRVADPEAVRDGVASQVHARVDGAPLAAGLVAFGTGVVIASLLPARDAEARAGAAAYEAVKDAAAPVAGELREDAQDVASGLREEVAASAHRVADQAQESARTAAEPLQG